MKATSVSVCLRIFLFAFKIPNKLSRRHCRGTVVVLVSNQVVRVSFFFSFYTTPTLSFTPRHMDFTPSINEHGIYFIATSFTPCSYATSSQSFGLSNITPFEISNFLFLSIYKKFKRAVIDAYVYIKYCRSR